MVARVRLERLQRAARLVQQGPIGRDPPGIRHRFEHGVRHQGRAEGSAFLRRPAAHADRALRAARRTVLPPAVPEFAGAADRGQPVVAEGQPRAEVRRRVPPRHAALHRSAIAQRRAEFRRRPLHRLRAWRFPARPVERAAADAVPRARSVCQRLAVLRAGQLARALGRDHHRRHPLRDVHAAARQEQPADQHRSGDRSRRSPRRTAACSIAR